MAKFYSNSCSCTNLHKQKIISKLFSCFHSCTLLILDLSIFWWCINKYLLNWVSNENLTLSNSFHNKWFVNRTALCTLNSVCVKTKKTTCSLCLQCLFSDLSLFINFLLLVPFHLNTKFCIKENFLQIYIQGIHQLW